MRKRTKAPYFINARYPGLCAETGRFIPRNGEALYDPNTRKIYSIDSKTAADFRSALADETYLNNCL